MVLSIPRRRKLIGISGGLLIVALCAIWLQWDNPVVRTVRDRLETIAYDTRLDLFHFGGQETHKGVVIIDIDERSLSMEGRWPWPREKVADLLQRLHQQGVVVTGIDAVFSEPALNPALQVMERLDPGLSDTPLLAEALERIAPALDGDLKLSAILREYDVVLGHLFRDDGSARGKLGPPLVIETSGEVGELSLAELDSYTANIPPLIEAATVSGFFNVSPDSDGQIRRYNLVMRNQGQIYPSLALEMVRFYLLVDKIELESAMIGEKPVIERILLPGTLAIPTDEQGRVLVPYRSPGKSFDYVSATDVIRGEADPSLLRNRIALVGSSAKGLFDLRSTPVHPLLPGVEVHANVIAGMLDYGDISKGLKYPYAPKWSEGANFSIIVVLGTLLAVLMPFLSVIWILMASLLSVFGLAWFNFWIWSDLHLLVAVTTPLMMIALLTVFNLFLGFVTETLGRHRLKDMFGQYVPHSLVERMNRSLEDFGFEGDRREMTVLFADICNFTDMSEKLTPQQLTRLLNIYLTAMTEIIFRQQGTVDKYVGDMIMAFWGAPLKDDEHAVHAIETALAMQEGLKALRPSLEAAGLPLFEIGIGINSGVMNVGNMGSSYRKAYTVLGDAVNLGSRIEALTRFYGTAVMVGEQTHRDQDGFVFRQIDRVRVKGKQDAVTIYEPVCRRPEVTPGIDEELTLHEQALELYFSRQWPASKTLFSQLSETHPDCRIYQVYLERIDHMSTADLPEDWDGVFVHKAK
ncbi:MAG: adenylate/guanylate cyclase domain-containing protein [Sedimenticola sp.]